MKPRLPKPRPVLLRQTMIPIYRLPVLLSVGDNLRDAFEATCPHISGIPDPSPTTAAGCMTNNEGAFGLLLVRGKMTHGNISHEVSHLTGLALDFVGVRYHPRNHEAFTYLDQWLTDWVYRVLDKHGEKALLAR